MRAWQLFLVLGLAACSGDKDEETTDGTEPAVVDCADPASNPWYGTCVETFMADCFDPSGACDITIGQTGSTTLEWANGASVVTSVGFGGGGLETLTDIIASDGTVCANGVTTMMDAGCDSRTVYTRTSDGASMEYCLFQDGSIDVTCPDGSMVSATADQQNAASSCQYGSDAEACTL